MATERHIPGAKPASSTTFMPAKGGFDAISIKPKTLRISGFRPENDDFHSEHLILFGRSPGSGFLIFQYTTFHRHNN